VFCAGGRGKGASVRGAFVRGFCPGGGLCPEAYVRSSWRTGPSQRGVPEGILRLPLPHDESITNCSASEVTTVWRYRNSIIIIIIIIIIITSAETRVSCSYSDEACNVFETCGHFRPKFFYALCTIKQHWTSLRTPAAMRLSNRPKTIGPARNNLCLIVTR